MTDWHRKLAFQQLVLAKSLSVGQAAERYGCTTRTVRYWCWNATNSNQQATMLPDTIKAALLEELRFAKRQQWQVAIAAITLIAGAFYLVDKAKQPLLVQVPARRFPMRRVGTAYRMREPTNSRQRAFYVG